MSSSGIPSQGLIRSPRGERARGRIVSTHGDRSFLPKVQDDVIQHGHEKETPSKRRLSRHVVDSQNQSFPTPGSAPISQILASPAMSPEVKIKQEIKEIRHGRSPPQHRSPSVIDLTGPTPEKWKTVKGQALPTNNKKVACFIDLSNDTDSEVEPASPPRRKLAVPGADSKPSAGIFFQASGSTGWAAMKKPNVGARRSRAGQQKAVAAAAAFDAAAALAPSGATSPRGKGVSLEGESKRYQEKGMDVLLCHPENLPGQHDECYLLPFLRKGS
ncbi:hypothetical protein NADE_006706 [Nannochloris sp. 'desiccata']|nr:hypothetical protein NADE_006706 [Chlorella desiccata (nom. nud.)]